MEGVITHELAELSGPEGCVPPLEPPGVPEWLSVGPVRDDVSPAMLPEVADMAAAKGCR